MRNNLAELKIKEPASVFAALGDPTRLHLVAHLSREGSKSITQLTENSKVTRQAVTKHLLLLEDAGLVRSSRHGRERIWKLETKRLEIARDYLGQIDKRWDAALVRLRNLVEK
jgi:DNA-binding transcriptional ArsR family regulator